MSIYQRRDERLSIWGVAKSVKLKHDVTVGGSFLGERFDRSFKAGDHEPKSEVDEEALRIAKEADDAVGAKTPTATEET